MGETEDAVCESIESLPKLPPGTGLAPVPEGWDVRYLLASPGPEEPFWATQVRRLNELAVAEFLVVVTPKGVPDQARALRQVLAWIETEAESPRRRGLGRSLLIFSEESLAEEWEKFQAQMREVNRRFN